uniref:Aquaporin9 putative n=1 Tax=Albugo laibachii Nc14 TaxID=890382 RepID=F0WIP5_9STRA|nr:aquaporin9 putative [Albugo laibachii Nc14]|eukprot:CCA21136.1 aquaporin9 putative [Albugo laibachii Nc14]
MPTVQPIYPLQSTSISLEYSEDASLTTEDTVDRKSCTREMFAEFLGTMILVVIGDGVVCQTVVSQGIEAKNAVKNQQNPDFTNMAGDWSTISFGYGIGLMLGLFVSAGVSGGHLNPAVSVAMCRHGRLPWKKLPYYVMAQFAGAFVGAMVVYIGYYPGLIYLDNWEIGTAGIFATYPKEHEGLFAGFFDEIIGTFLLLLGIFAITDKGNNEAEKGMKPLAIGLLLSGIALSFGYNTGFALNPARDFSPRLLTALAGWGFKVFTANNAYFWVPLLAPIVGGLLGAETYQYLIARHHPRTFESSSDAQKDFDGGI